MKTGNDRMSDNLYSVSVSDVKKRSSWVSDPVGFEAANQLFKGV